MKNAPQSLAFAFAAVVLVSSTRAAEPFVELYAPAHFGNWYEVAGPREMRTMLAEAKQWGFTRYGDWFDTLDCNSPFEPDRQYDLGDELWQRKLANFRTAQSLGLQTDLIITPNHVFHDQLKPEWLAKSGGRVFGQLICPSVPAAREIILDNHRRMFQALADAGVQLTAINAAPYDYGGCQCSRCQPWITTFAQLVIDIHRIARQTHPKVELQFIGWWWTPKEHEDFAQYMDANAPGLTAGMALHIPYDQTTVADVPLPKGCVRNAFVHIGYGEMSKPRDVYGHLGPVAAPGRLQQTVRELQAHSVQSVVAYSEGIFDDVNKCLLAGLWSKRFASPDELLAAYARRYLDADDVSAPKWAAFLTRWGLPYDRDPSEERTAFAQLPGRPLDWRRRQWELKVELFAEHRAISLAPSWTPARLAHADAFWAARETLQRQVYGLGPQRHIFADRFLGLSWYDSWAKQVAAASQPASTRNSEE